jgi:serine/threonine-protein kinase
MKREDWDRIGTLFDEALKRSGAERDEFLAELGDQELEVELRSLLAAHEGRGVVDELGEGLSGPEARRLLRLGPGDPLGPYRIVREIASGGTATVYEARDLRLEREVAIKVLRPELAAVLGADRFVQEMKTTAQLQHPHILPLFDSGHADGFLYFVMPYIEGESLRDKLERKKQLGIEEAVRITTEVADALGHAHRHGIVHRDIKPENILLQEGRPLVADFGIALAVSAASGGRTTETGLSLGTPHYMSPEQATAEKKLTHQTDIYSLGCVLYEMLAGEPPHTGTSALQIMRKIVTEEVRPVTDVRKSVPPNVAAATAKALEKVPADRFETAEGFAEALKDPAFTAPAIRAPPGAARPARWSALAVGLAVVALVATVVGLWGWLRPGAPEVDRPVAEFYLDPPDPAVVFGGALALSPDGRRLVANAWTDEGPVLYQRVLDERDWRIIPGTEGAYAPFFSPDGEWLGFFSQLERAMALKRVPVEGGSAQSITRLNAINPGAGASWGPDNTVVFSITETVGGVTPGLFTVPVDGGVPERLTTPDTARLEFLHISPHHLPGGKVVLFTAVTELNRSKPFVAALSLESGTVTRLTPGMTPFSDRAGQVVYATPATSTVAQVFNPRTLAFEGPPKPLAEGVAISFQTVARHTVSSDGSLAYRLVKGPVELLLVSREGETRSLYSAGVESGLFFPRFSPSGDRIAFVQGDRAGLNVWVYSFDRGTAQRLSFEGPSWNPAWTADGRSIGYSVDAEDDGLFVSHYLRAADGTGSAERILVGAEDMRQMEFAPGDRKIVFYSSGKLFRSSLGSDSGPEALMETEHPTEYLRGGFDLSPDGRWIAYTSKASGFEEVYVRSYPDMGPPTVVSVSGGGFPAWSGDAKEIFYWSRGWMMAASVRYDGSRVRVVGRDELFPVGSFPRLYFDRNYDVHPNVQEFALVGRERPRIVWRVNALAGEP